MPRYKVTAVATLVFEVDAPRPAAAMGALARAFTPFRATDQLQGTRFTFDSTERECSNPQLMTTIFNQNVALECEEA